MLDFGRARHSGDDSLDRSRSCVSISHPSSLDHSLHQRRELLGSRTSEGRSARQDPEAFEVARRAALLALHPAWPCRRRLGQFQSRSRTKVGQHSIDVDTAACVRGVSSLIVSRKFRAKADIVRTAHITRLWQSGSSGSLHKVGLRGGTGTRKSIVWFLSVGRSTTPRYHRLCVDPGSTGRVNCRVAPRSGFCVAQIRPP